MKKTKGSIFIIMNIKTKKSVLTAYALFSLAVGIGLAIYRTVLLKNYYDPYNQSFEPGSGGTFRALEYVLLILALITLTSLFFTKNTHFQLFSVRASTTSVSICAVCGFIFAAIAAISLIYYSEVIFDFRMGSIGASLMRVAAIFCMFFVAMYFLACASTMFSGKKNHKAALSLSLPLFAIFYLSHLYFDTTLMFQDTNRIMGQVAFISVLAFFVSEANIATGHTAYSLHFATSLACIVCVCTYVLPILSLVAFWEMSISTIFLIDFSAVGILLYALFSAFNAIRTLEACEK